MLLNILFFAYRQLWKEPSYSYARNDLPLTNIIFDSKVKLYYMQNLVSVMKYCMVFWMVLMILFWGKQERERSTQFQKYSRRSVWGVSLSKMLLHFWLNLRPWFLGNGLLVKVCDTLKIYYMVSVYSQKWTENIWSLYQSFRSDLPTLGDKRIPTLTLYILETRRKSWVSDVLKRV